MNNYEIVSAASDAAKRNGTTTAQELAKAVRAVEARPAPRFTCRSCGGHSDTTMRGHCDDCEA